jgi:hypothetical protein
MVYVIAPNRNNVNALETIAHPQLSQSRYAPWLKQLTYNGIALLETSFREESFTALPSEGEGGGTAQDASADHKGIISMVYLISTSG